MGAASDMTIGNCYATGNVSAGSTVGGLIGYQFGGNTANCYAVGTATGGSAVEVGGLVGGTTGSISGCYFNSVNTNNGLGTPATLANMRLQATYSGWDFTAIWGITAGVNSGYPYLRSIDF